MVSLTLAMVSIQSTMSVIVGQASLVVPFSTIGPTIPTMNEVGDWYDD